MRFNLPRNWLGFLIIAVLAIGILFRFVNLDGKFYWIDETYTSLRVSGYTEAEMLKEISYNKINSPSDLQKYQQVNSEKTLSDSLNSLATEDPQHPPLYYVLARFWAQWFGTSVTAMRSLAAVISLLVFPAIYWLAWELFESSAVAWMAIAIFAISPYQILFAQEARQYSLWTLTTILSSAALLRAMRPEANQNPIWLVSHWALYAVTAAMGFYTHLLFVCVAAAHAIYVALIANWRDIKTFIAYYVAALIALIGFMPTLVNTVENLNQIRSTTVWAEQTNLLRLVSRWVGSLSIAFFDIGIDGSASATQLALIIPAGIAILALVGYAIYFLCRQTPKRVWLMVLLLIATTAIFLALPDVLKGGRRSANPRYLVPCYVGIQLAVAYLLSTKISNKFDNLKQQRLWKIVIVSLFCAGIISGGVSSGADSWWNKGSGWLRAELEVAAIVNSASNPLIISDANIAYIMALSYRLQPQVKLLIEPRCYTSCYKNQELARKKPEPPTIPGGFSELFLYRPSSNLRSAIGQQNYQINPAVSNVDLNLWKITKK
ncbi:glycosyltransferase family 39 protein [Tychonema sp. LEGE 07199]|uniref:glycosyltransferase family 39 protein n=1 Tax=unclassified Tychonema TaxID=2642144 RepID=UPI001880EDE3|nr:MULTISPECIES: glycosyltransferase family 39 protein [unclassified Tychonema]MBE9120836.1 glycosyltransferase family 39 protein [Tychonema sp. LEGE 07199]MBE9133150.1 glycosyltransferase family 39 protein [Tychonema sp. LEGE 07196]